VQTRLLRSALEWGQEMMGRDDERTYGAVEASESVRVMMWPPGEFKQLPRGTTAGSFFRTHVRRQNILPTPPAEACCPAAAHALTYGRTCADVDLTFFVQSPLELITCGHMVNTGFKKRKTGPGV